jgi:site-specific DNA-adenine methylase
MGCGKRQLLPESEQLMPKIGTDKQFFQTICWGGALFLSLERKNTTVL